MYVSSWNLANESGNFQTGHPARTQHQLLKVGCFKQVAVGEYQLKNKIVSAVPSVSWHMHAPFCHKASPSCRWGRSEWQCRYTPQPCRRLRLASWRIGQAHGCETWTWRNEVGGMRDGENRLGRLAKYRKCVTWHNYSTYVYSICHTYVWQLQNNVSLYHMTTTPCHMTITR